MKVRDVKGYEDWKENSLHGNAPVVFRFAERWADLMEERIESGERLEDIAKETSHKADTEGITGFMYVVAVNILSRCWVYGEELRKWHNGGYKGSGVLNPASMTVKTRG